MNAPAQWLTTSRRFGKVAGWRAECASLLVLMGSVVTRMKWWYTTARNLHGVTRTASWKRHTHATPARLPGILSLCGGWRADCASGELAPAELSARPIVSPQP